MQKIGISVITTFHDRVLDAEELLTGIYELISAQDEVIIIDDASSDQTSDIIASVVENSGHENTFFLDNASRRGRGTSLQHALEETSRDLIWMVDQPLFPDRDFLDAAAGLLRSTDSLSVIMGGFSVPKDVEGWLSLLKKGKFPPDSAFLWNKKAIPSHHFFVSPYWSGFHATELALRLSNKGAFITADSPMDWPEKPVDSQIKRRFLTHLLGSGGIEDEWISEITSILTTLVSAPTEEVKEGEPERLIAEAERLNAQGNAVAALEKLEELLRLLPTHEEARKLKVTLLNKMRRYVEAAELKHKIQQETPESDSEEAEDFEIEEDIASVEPDDLDEETGSSEEPEQEEETEVSEVEDQESKPDLTVVIPTVGMAKNRTLKCLDALFHFEQEQNMEVLLIDNGCLDDTLEVVNQQFGENVVLLSNEFNPGFGQTINQALEIAKASTIAVMHNDVILTSPALSDLRKHLEDNPEFGILAPMADASLNASQLKNEKEQEPEDVILDTEYADSFLMIFRSDIPVRFDEFFGEAYFEDMDFAYQLREKGLKTGLVPSISVKHLFGTSMRDFGLNPLDDLFWKNMAYFNKKWQLEPEIPDALKEQDPLVQLITIGNGINVLYPEDDLVDYANQLLSSEVKTQIMKDDFDVDSLFGLIRMMMALDQRDVLRKLEENLIEAEPSRELYQLLISFYYKRNIFSRCKKYIEAIEQESRPFSFQLFEAKIAYEERETDKAAQLVSELGKERPSQPDLLLLASRLHGLLENEEQSKRYLEKAEHLRPGISDQYS